MAFVQFAALVIMTLLLLWLIMDFAHAAHSLIECM